VFEQCFDDDRAVDRFEMTQTPTVRKPRRTHEFEPAGQAVEVAQHCPDRFHGRVDIDGYAHACHHFSLEKGCCEHRGDVCRDASKGA